MTVNRNIVVKMLLNADEFVEFDQACTRERVTHSAQLRDLAKIWITRRNRRQKSQVPEGHGHIHVHNMAMSLPGRAHYGQRLRV